MKVVFKLLMFVMIFPARLAGQEVSEVKEAQDTVSVRILDAQVVEKEVPLHQDTVSILQKSTLKEETPPPATGKEAGKDKKHHVPHKKLVYTPLPQYFYWAGLDSLTNEPVSTLLYHQYVGQYKDVVMPYLSDSLMALSPPDLDYYRLFTPVAYYNSSIRQISEMRPMKAYADTLKLPNLTAEVLPVDLAPFHKTERAGKQVNQVLMHVYMNEPELVVTTEERIMSRQVYRKEVEKEVSPKNSILQLFTPDKADESAGKVDVVIRKPNFWYHGGNGSLQITQNYISENWHKGGESNNALMGNLQLFANYNDKEKLQFENLMEARFGFNSVPSDLDTMRIYRVNTDVFRLYSKLGLQAASTWYYTVSGEFNTQFFRNYKANTNELVTAFLAPANLTFSVGMDYKFKTKRANLSVFMSPFTYNLRMVRNEKVDETRFGLKKDENSLQDYGSKVQSTITWTIIPSVIWSSRLYYFTNYKKVEAEWENTVNFVLNRYLSTKVFVHQRFDDGVKRMGDHSYLQLQELLSFGVNYKW